MKTAVEGIMYPVDAARAIKGYPDAGIRPSELGKGPYVLQVPHCAWEKGRDAYKGLDSWLSGKTFDRVFVLAPLHKGPIRADDEFTVYAPEDGKLSGSDWEISLEVPSSIRTYTTFSDDICSEEQSLEVLAPILSTLQNCQVCHLLAPGKDSRLRSIVKIIHRDYPSALVLVSNNSDTDCAQMWMEALT